MSTRMNEMLVRSRRKTLSRTRWSPEEDAKLKKLVNQYGEDDWFTIANLIPDRSLSQCATRWTRILSPNIIKGQWTPEDDERLRSLVGTIGPRKWTEIANYMPGRVGKQCRERWHNHLDPNINKAPWTQQEDSLIMELYHEFGSQWNKIASSLEGRTDNSVKNHFNSSLKKIYNSTYLGAPPTTIRRRASAYNRTEETGQRRSSPAAVNGETIICQPELFHLVKSSSSSSSGNGVTVNPSRRILPSPAKRVSNSMPLRIVSVCSLNASSDNDVSSTSTDQMQYSESPQEQSDFMDDEDEDPEWMEEEVEEDPEEEQDPLFQPEPERTRISAVDVNPQLKALEHVLMATWVCDVCNDEFDTYESLQEHLSGNYCPGEQSAESDIPLHYFTSSRHKPSRVRR